MPASQLTNHSVQMDSFLDTQEEVTRDLHGSDDEPRTHPPVHKRDYAIGIGLILIITLLWTYSSFVTKDLYISGYNKPFLVTYMNISTHSLYLIPFLLRQCWNCRKRERGAFHVMCYGDWWEFIPSHQHEMSDPTLSYKTSQTEDPLPPLTKKQTAHLALAFSCLSFITNWSANVSLELTSVASATILWSTSAFFTLVIGRLCGVETLGLVKIGAVVTSFAGVLLVSLSDSSSQPSTGSTQQHLYLAGVKSRATLGDALALITALFGAICTILLKVRTKEESRIDIQLFFGLVGLSNILFLWPIGLMLHLTGAESFELPHTKQALYATMTNMAITIMSDYLWALAMFKTSPLVVTVGLSLTIPFAVVVDLLRNTPTHGAVMVGAMLVIASFAAIGLDTLKGREKSLRKIEERPW